MSYDLDAALFRLPISHFFGSVARFGEGWEKFQTVWRISISQTSDLVDILAGFQQLGEPRAQSRELYVLVAEQSSWFEITTEQRSRQSLIRACKAD